MEFVYELITHQPVPPALAAYFFVISIGMLVAKVIACFEIVTKPLRDGSDKSLWLMLVLFLPVFGVAIYFYKRETLLGLADDDTPF